MIMSTLSIILSVASLPIAHAAPWHTLHARQSNGNGTNSSSSNTGLSSSVWIPVVFIGGLFLLGAVWLLQRNMSSRRADDDEVEVSNGATTRELTAAELSGGSRTARRQRRPRRTPSQISTRSLPVYMKEPGDGEVVIYRGLEDMDEEMEGELGNANDSTMSTDMTSPTERTGRDSHEDTRALLDSTRHSLNPSLNSYDHQGSDDSHARLIDVRGEAPAYETIDLNSTEEPAPVYNSRPNSSAVMSGFFSRFMSHRGNSGPTNEPPTLSPLSDTRNSTFHPSHSRQSTLQAGLASTDSHDTSRRSHVGRTHRSGSSTGSVFTLFSRTGSGSHENGQMTSPSVISLNAISPPLTHTATRTEFAFPRTGPTSEQVKFLSSKETFSRFGVPYGPDALAFASSSSRLTLPPDFDSLLQSSIGELSPIPDSEELRRSTASTDANPELGESPFPTSTEPSQGDAPQTDQPSLSRQESGLNFEVEYVTPPLRISKQKSTPNIGMGQPPLSKSVLKSKSVANIQSDGDDSVSSLSLRPAPQIMVQLPSNNPSLVNLAEGRENNPSTGSSASGNNPKGPQNTHVYPLSSDSDSDSDNASEAETHSNLTEVDKTLVTTDLESSNMYDVTLTPEKVAALKARSDLTKTTTLGV